MKPRLRLGLDGNWYPSPVLFRLAEVNPQLLCAAIRIIRRCLGRESYASGLNWSGLRTLRPKVHAYLTDCEAHGRPIYRHGLNWRVSWVERLPIAAVRYGLPYSHYFRNYTLELI